MRTRTGFVSALVLAALLAGPALAQQNRAATPAQPETQAQQQLNQKDLAFVKEAAIGGMAEVELGKLAEQNAQNDQVKQFGTRMVRDHGAGNNELGMVASGKSVVLPDRLDQKHMQTRDKLAKMKGAEFDRAYMREMVEDHDKDLKAFRQHAQSAADPDLKNFAQKMVPVIEEHDKLAHDIMKSLTAVGSSHPAPADRQR
jgi:putative membrane protein